MSGHSHYATIKRQKGLKDAAKGKIFSKLAKVIQIAVKTGGGMDPDSNAKLRIVIDAAKRVNMPKDNIERAIKKGVGGGENLEEVTYEGFGPSGIAVIVEAATDNRNRTGQEFKNLFEKGGGSLAGPGSVAFNFEPKGLLIVKKEGNSEEQMLSLIDAGVEDLQEADDAIEAYVAVDKLGEIRDRLQGAGFSVISFEIIQKPKNLQTINDANLAKKILGFLDNLENLDDVQKVFTNINIEREVLDQINSNVQA